MDYDFGKQGRGMGKIVFALALDRKKMTERIVIGEIGETRRHLEDGTGSIYFDRTRPLGALLIDFESDTGMEWNRNLMRLSESYGKAVPFAAERWKMAAPAADFLRGKCADGEPSAMFSAIRTWEEYKHCFYLNHGADMLIRRLSSLYRPFFLYERNRPWQDQAAAALSQVLRGEEAAVELWYPALKRSFEYVVASTSFLPVIAYYLHKIEEWGFVFQRCKVCGKDFVARSRHYELCSDGCRKKQAAEAKREFDERAKGDRLEQLYEAAYYYWYNRLRKLKREKAAKKRVPTKSVDFVGRGGATERADNGSLPPLEHSEVRDDDKAAAVGEAFKAFRKEAVKRKGEVKCGKMKLNDFSSWLIEQQNKVDRLMDG